MNRKRPDEFSNVAELEEKQIVRHILRKRIAERLEMFEEVFFRFGMIGRFKVSEQLPRVVVFNRIESAQESIDRKLIAGENLKFRDVCMMDFLSLIHNAEIRVNDMPDFRVFLHEFFAFLWRDILVGSLSRLDIYLENDGGIIVDEVSCHVLARNVEQARNKTHRIPGVKSHIESKDRRLDRRASK